MARYSQWLIFAPVAILALFAPTANAQSQQGLHSVAYSVSDIPPIQSDDAYPICNEEIENNINRSYDGEPLEGCPDDMFMVHMTGTIIIPEHETILFYIAADDGGVIKIGGNEFGTWDDKGCSAEWVDLSDLPAGNSLLDFFFYEHGGGTCAMLAWNIDNQGWEIVPDEAFLTSFEPSPTTVPSDTSIPLDTIAPDTTIPADTTIADTTTSSAPQTTSSQLQITTTSIQEEPSSTSTVWVAETTTTIGFLQPLLPLMPVTVDPLPIELPVEEVPFPQPTPDVLPDEMVDLTPDTMPYEVADTIPYTPLEIILDTFVPTSEDLCNVANATVCPPETLPFVGEVISDAVLTDMIDNAFTPDASTEEITAALDDILGADLSTEQFLAVMDAVLSDTSDTEQVSEVLVSLLSSNLSGQELTIVMDTVFSAEATLEEMGAIVDNLLGSDLSVAELEAVFTAAFDGDLSDAETVALAEEILASPIDDKEFGTVINAIFDEKVSDEVLAQTFDAILTPELSDNKFAQVVNVLENATITNEQVAQVVDLVIAQADGVSEGQATELAMSPKVLESVSGDQAAEVFDAIVASALSSDEGASIVGAISQAATEVKKSFETQLNVFEGIFDMYPPLGSQIPVSQRRTLMAVSLGAVATAVGTRVRR
jgi:hypothetical protein